MERIVHDGGGRIGVCISRHSPSSWYLRACSLHYLFDIPKCQSKKGRELIKPPL